jgi:hypothetical protein
MMARQIGAAEMIFQFDHPQTFQGLKVSATPTTSASAIHKSAKSDTTIVSDPPFISTYMISCQDKPII